MINICVVIPVKNGAATLERCLQSLVEQAWDGLLEILVLDSESTDDSRKIAERFECKIVTIPQGQFNHGLTRNLGVSLAKGDLIYFTVQDAYLPEREMLSRMAVHFMDEAVMGVVGMQAVPHDLDKNPAVWFKRMTVPEIEIRHYPIPGAFQQLSKEERFAVSNWDNVNAMYRKTALEKVPFRETNFSEDWLWAHDALTAGMKIVRDPSLVVYHYHHQSFKYNFRVRYILSYYFFIFFGVHPELPSFLGMLKQYLVESKRIYTNRRLTIWQQLYWALHNLNIHLSTVTSIVIFKIIFFFGKVRLLHQSYKWFLKEIPQGKLKSVRKQSDQTLKESISG